MFVDSIFHIKFPSATTMMSRIGALIREREVSVLANEVDLINLEIISSTGIPIIVTTDKRLAVFMDSKDGTSFRNGIVCSNNMTTLVVDGASDFVVKNLIFW